MKKKSFNINSSLAVAVGLLLPFALRLASAPTANLSYWLLAAYAMLGRAQAIQAIGMSWFFTMINPGIAPGASLGSIGKYAVFLAACFSVILRSDILTGNMKIKRPVIYTVSIGIFFVIHSFLISPMPDVSILKATSWLMVTATLFAAWGKLNDEERGRLFNKLYVGLVVLMVISIPLVVLPVGYLRNGNGFQGILNHPQAFGSTMAILGALSGSSLLAQRKTSWSNVAVFCSCLVLILLSEARTAGVALVLGLMLGFIVVPWLSGKGINKVVPGLKSQRLWGAIGVFLIFGLVFYPFISQKVDNYISKSGRAGDIETLTAAYEISRGALIDRLLVNIQENPVGGIGFGIASDPIDMKVERDPFFSFPVSAPIEKGVLPLAVLEELGVIGASLVLLWFLMVLRSASANGLEPLVVTIMALLLNMGENTFFSPGGFGALILIFVSWACTGPGKSSYSSKQVVGNL